MSRLTNSWMTEKYGQTHELELELKKIKLDELEPTNLDEPGSNILGSHIFCQANNAIFFLGPPLHQKLRIAYSLIVVTFWGNKKQCIV